MSANTPENWLADLPPDLLTDILAHLPVRSILRLKTVCKSWYALFRNPNFTAKHFKHSQSNSCFLLTCHRSMSINNITGNFITLISDDKLVDIPFNVDIPFLSISKPLRLSGSCNGLICLSVLPLGSIIVLWNPATGEFKDLPISQINRSLAGPIKVVFGFGFDEVANDYKLLRVVYYCYPHNQVEIYSLNSNSWRLIESKLKFLIFDSSSSVFLNGKFHWTGIGFEEFNGEKVIISFDMATEEFHYMFLPMYCPRGCEEYDDDEDDKFKHQLVVLKGSLAMIGCGGHGRDNTLEVWVMNEYGDIKSWTKTLSCTMYSGIDRPLACKINGKVLLGKNYIDLFVYDYATEEIKNIGSRGAAYWSDVFDHVETLCPIKGGKFVGGTTFDDIVPDLFFVRKFDLVIA